MNEAVSPQLADEARRGMTPLASFEFIVGLLSGYKYKARLLTKNDRFARSLCTAKASLQIARQQPRYTFTLYYIAKEMEQLEYGGAWMTQNCW